MADESVIGPERVRNFTWEPGDIKTIDQADLRPVEQTLCMTCLWRHYGKATCRAFPAGIPDVFWGTGGYEAPEEHRTPYPGDHGYQYTSREAPE